MIDQLIALGQVVLIDVALAGDNAIVVGMAASGVASRDRRKVIFWGIAAAVVLRIAFATVTTRLMEVIGLTLAGGILLAWVCWKLWREIRAQEHEHRAAATLSGIPHDGEPGAPVKTVSAAIWQVALADVSMSLDNVIAVAGAAREHPWVLIAGLMLSVALMGIAASYIAKLLKRHHWIAYLGLLVIVYVAADMMWRGGGEVIRALFPH